MKKDVVTYIIDKNSLQMQIRLSTRSAANAIVYIVGARRTIQCTYRLCTPPHLIAL